MTNSKHDLPHDGVVNFVSRGKNVCDGVGAILSLAYEHEGERLEDDPDAETTLSMLRMESLMTLARASVDNPGPAGAADADKQDTD